MARLTRSDKEWWTGRKRKSSNIIARLDALKDIDGEKRIIAVTVENNRNPKNGKLANRYAEILLEKEDYKFIDTNKKTKNDVLNLADRTSAGRAYNKALISPKTSKKNMVKKFDAYCEELARIYCGRARTFISSGGNHVFQKWKGNSYMNLRDTYTLYNSIYGEVRTGKSGRKVLWKGR